MAFNWRTDRIGAARRGENPTVLRRLPSGWAVIGDEQFLPGYCVLLYDGDADHLTDLPRPERLAFLEDMAILGEAVSLACSRLDPQFLRVNYEILGNEYAHLHAHIFARYAWEPDDRRRTPVWLYPDRKAAQYALGPQHAALRTALTAALDEVLAQAHP